MTQDGHMTAATAAGLEGLSLGERIVRVARMAVEAHLAQSSSSVASNVPEPETRRQVVTGGAGGRLIPIDPADTDLSSRAVRHG